MKPESVSTKQERIAKLARNNPERAFFTLHQYIDYEWMRYAYDCTRKDSAAGVDGQTAEEYAANLSEYTKFILQKLATKSSLKIHRPSATKSTA